VIESELQDIHLVKSINVDLIQYSKDSEYWEILLLMGFGNPSATQDFYQKLRHDLDRNDWRIPLVDIGEARFLSIIGRHFDSFLQLEKASNTVFSRANYINETIHSEIMSLHSYVFANLNLKISQQTNSLPLLLSGIRLTSLNSFKLAYEYKITIHQVGESYSPISELIEVVEKLKNNQLWVLACMGYRQIGIFFRQRKEYNKAHHYFNLALSMAEDLDLRVTRNQILNAKAYTLFFEGKLEAAEELFAKIRPEGRLDSILPILNENLSLMAKARKDMTRSINHMKDALAVTSELDSVGHLPGECLYLGQAYENHLGDLDQAEHFYRLGYEHSMRYASHGISLTGDRKDVVETYVNFISRKKNAETALKAVPREDNFAFSQGKPWKDIKDIFQHQLICFHAAELTNSKLLAAKLDMPPSTLYSLQDRLKTRGYVLPEKDQNIPPENLDLHDFFIEHQNLTWNEINQIFEREIMHYLYERYGYNKHRLAKVLGLSYPSIIQKTRELTQVNEHFLPN